MRGTGWAWGVQRSEVQFDLTSSWSFVLLTGEAELGKLGSLSQSQCLPMHAGKISSAKVERKGHWPPRSGQEARAI